MSEGWGWHSRGYLPHFDRPELLQAVTFRLHDAVPEALIEGWKAELDWIAKLPAADPREVELRARIARYEDAGYGECWLRLPEIAQLVQDTLLHFDGRRYRMLAWCIMPNHVHTLIETLEDWPLEGVMHSWKSYSAQEANKLLKRKGAFWCRDYFDRYIRDERHYANAVSYILNNPVKAGLVPSPDLWPYLGAPLLGAPASLPADSATGAQRVDHETDGANQEGKAGRDAGAPR